MANFKTSFLLTIANEGGYANRGDSDVGGETYMGISRRYHPGWMGWKDIDLYKWRMGGSIPNNEKNIGDYRAVESFYYKEFWEPLKLAFIDDQRLCNQVFDHAVTSGPSDAIKLLQDSVGSDVDGKIGPITIANVRECMAKYDRLMLSRRYFKLRVIFYLSLAEKNASNEANLPSWISRTAKCYKG